MLADGRWEGGFATRLEDGRGHALTVDLPESEGGQDTGSSALELSVLSLAGCISTIFALVARKRRLAFSGLAVHLSAERAPGAATITSVAGTVRVQTRAPEEAVTTALNLTVRTCPVGVLFERAGVPLEIRAIAEPPANEGPAAPPGGRSEPPAEPGAMARRAWRRDEAVRVLDASDRPMHEDPGEVWDRVHLAPGETVVDIGAGTGYFAVPAARRVGPTGLVYAVDLSTELIELLHERKEREALPQLRPIASTLAAIPLPTAVADVVLLANVLHDIPFSTVAEAVRLLKPSGRLVNVDWKTGDSPGGPPQEIRLAPEDATHLLERYGLHRVDRWELGPWHYGIVLRAGPAPSAGHRPPRTLADVR